MKQTLVIVNRGITDQTPCLVWPWEIAVLESVHGEGNVTIVDHAETLRWLEKNRVHILSDGKPKDSEDADRRNIAEVFNPANDIQGEYERLAAKYGQHLELPMANVEYVYGRLSTGAFEKAVRAHTRPTRDVIPTADPARAAKALTGAEVRKRLDELKIDYDPAATVAALRILLKEHEIAVHAPEDPGPGVPDSEEDEDEDLTDRRRAV